MCFCPKARRVLGDMRYSGWTVHWPKQNTWTHTVKWEFFLLVCGFLLSPDYMTSCPVAEYYLEVKI